MTADAMARDGPPDAIASLRMGDPSSSMPQVP
jgi:hypothetical protein